MTKDKKIRKCAMLNHSAFVIISVLGIRILLFF